MAIELAAQDLLNNPNVLFSGFLKTISKEKSKTWVLTFTIITDEKVYFYKDSFSKKPKLIESLRLFEKCENYKTDDQNFPWTFILRPFGINKRYLKFSAASEREMLVVMDIFRKNCFQSKDNRFHREDLNQGLRKMSAQNSLEQSLKPPATISPISQSTPTTLYRSKTTENRALPLIPKQNTIYSSNEYEEMEGLYTSQRLDSSKSISEKLEKVLFTGTREEANEILKNHNYPGIYLIRTDGVRKVLTVKNNDKTSKYVLETDQSSEKIFIKGQMNKFSSLYELLVYYHENEIPFIRCRLTIPYKLLDYI